MDEHFFFVSHSLEALVKRLGQWLENGTPLFNPPLIVIPHPAMKEWLQFELCKVGTNKAVVGLEFTGWKAALQKLIGPLPIPSPLELSAALWDFCGKIELTDGFSQYIDGFTLSETEKTIFEEINRLHSWKTVPEALEGLCIPSMPVILFGIDFLPAPIHQFFLKMSNLQIYRFSPCAMFWEDFCSASEKKRILRSWHKKGVSSNRLEALDEMLRDSQRLLANWGMIGRKMLFTCEWEAETDYLLEPSGPSHKFLPLGLRESPGIEIDREGGSIEAIHPPSLSTQSRELSRESQCKEFTGKTTRDTLLNAIKLDLLFFEKTEVSFEDKSIQCMQTGASRLQEVQWLNEEIHRLVAGGLQFSDIRVYAPDISLYAPIIEFTFDQVPFRISKVDLARKSGCYQAILQLFRLVKGRWESADLLELFQKPAFQLKMKWKPEKIERIREWIEMGHIRWGVNNQHKKETTDVGAIDPNIGSWENGWDELLDSLIYFRPEMKSQMNWSEIELFENFYETFHRLQKNIFSWREEKTLLNWATEIGEFIEETLYFDDEADILAKNAFNKFIEGLQKASRAFPIETFPFSWVETSFASTAIEEGGALLNAVRFTSLTPGAILPAKVIVLLGMDEDSFPRSASFKCKTIDAPTPPDFDRYILLQTIFSAKDQLLFSYGNRSKEDGKAVSPSLLLQELFSYIENTFRPSETLIKEAHVVKPLYIPQQSLLSNSASVPELEISEKPIPLQELKKFFRSPPQYYLTEVIGIELQKEPESEWKEFSLSNLDRHLVLKGSLDQEVKMLTRLSLPLGMFGDLAKKNLSQEIGEYQKHLRDWGIDPASISPDDLTVPGGVLYLGADDVGGMFRKWPEILAGLNSNEGNKIFCLRTGRVREVKEPDMALKLATDLFLRCQKSPCFLHAEWADSVLRKKMAFATDQIKDPVLRWIIQRSPDFDLEKERKVWEPLFSETFSALIALFPVRGQHAEI